MAMAMRAGAGASVSALLHAHGRVVCDVHVRGAAAACWLRDRNSCGFLACRRHLRTFAAAATSSNTSSNSPTSNAPPTSNASPPPPTGSTSIPSHLFARDPSLLVTSAATVDSPEDLFRFLVDCWHLRVPLDVRTIEAISAAYRYQDGAHGMRACMIAHGSNVRDARATAIAGSSTDLVTWSTIAHETASLRVLSSSPSSSPATPASSSITAERIARFLDGCSSAHSGQDVFANADTSLAHITHYGFDYDYTLANYNDRVLHLIYEEAKRYLVEQMGYPPDVLNGRFDPSFAIRGLHFDSRTGFLLKLDQFGKIQMETVHRGRQRVERATVVAAYEGRSVNREYEEQYLHMMSDLFSCPEACLLADVIQVFHDQSHDFSADYIYRDVSKAIQFVHTSGVLHNTIARDPSIYLDANPLVGEYLQRLRAGGKKTFLLTNSPFKFVDAGMRYLLGLPASPSPQAAPLQGTNWLDLFDVCIVSARKPLFWSRKGHFRQIDLKTGSLSFRPVSKLERGMAYTEGGLHEFARLAGSLGSNTIYMGDNTAADLVTPSEHALWKTVAIVKELARETEIMGGASFQTKLGELLQLEALIDFGQLLTDAQSQKLNETLKTRRSAIRHDLLCMFNAHFGSVLRTANHRTKLFFQVSRFADVYTSSLTNFLHYPLHYCFYAQRSMFAHEPSVEHVLSQAALAATATHRRRQ